MDIATINFIVFCVLAGMPFLCLWFKKHRAMRIIAVAFDALSIMVGLYYFFMVSPYMYAYPMREMVMIGWLVFNCFIIIPIFFPKDR